VKGGVEARHLRQVWLPFRNRLNKSKFGGEMFRGVGDSLVELGDQFGGDRRRRGMFQSMDHPVPDTVDRFENAVLFQPSEHEIRRGLMVRGFDSPLVTLLTTGRREPCRCRAGSVQVALQRTCQLRSAGVHRQLDAGRAGIDGEDR
jgi:hypothetical protein